MLAELENRRSYRSVANVSVDGRQNGLGRKTCTIVESRVLKRDFFFSNRKEDHGCANTRARVFRIEQ